MEPYFFPGIGKIRGELELAGDKSISHRAVIAASLAEGTSVLRNLSEGEDVRATRQIFEKLGVRVHHNGEECVIEGRGRMGLRGAEEALDAANSGTTARLMAGILANQNFPSIITGDSSLSKRPMARVLQPLKMMGAEIRLTPAQTLPMEIFPVQELHPISYTLPVASAQVKSAILLAGLFLEGTTEVIETHPTRNHTELMFGLQSKEIRNRQHIYSSRANYPAPLDFTVPGDVSSAAFYIVLTLLRPYSELLIRNAGLNKTRTGYISVLRNMGANIEESNVHSENGEPVGDLYVSTSSLINVEIEKEMIPNIIDEIPILTIAGLFAEGQFNMRNVEELRVKESDRISALCSNLRTAGLDVQEYQDGFSFEGAQAGRVPSRPFFQSLGDHRIGMAFAVLSLLLSEGGTIDDMSCVNISNPGFIEHIKKISI